MSQEYISNDAMEVETININSIQIIQKEKPDFVILEMTEATIDRLLNDNPKWIKEAANK